MDVYHFVAKLSFTLYPGRVSPRRSLRHATLKHRQARLSTTDAIEAIFYR
ncbi:hypothetical protein T11_14045 [Trichinella zimbabwensis]|uniref:Uncharacterized protein n=1 Tax=Trichinella zimbabwensis TaxID=268475 RepID=A0A0V1GK92_9BILA|nr:hypothetical protein T11_14045 [Trichinella zimbabwensis]